MQPAWLLLLACLTAFSLQPATAQEAEEGEEPADAVEVADPAAAADDAEGVADDSDSEDGEAEGDAAEADATDVIDLDDPTLADLDRQSYEEDDDDFTPTEEVPADQAIPFPTDI